MKTLNEAIAYFHSLERFGVNPGLERIRRLCEMLGHPEKGMRYAHVAGTNGKGTVCTEIANTLREAGYRTGLYVSPYVVDFRERIQIDNEMVAPETLVNAACRVAGAVAALNGEGVFPTEFEAVTAAAFLCFRAAGCDIVVLETGLGGRFDATNVIEAPVVSVITSISPDHVKILGNTLGEIAYEKCGIIKPRRYVVTPAAQSPQALETVRARAAEESAYLFEADPQTLFTAGRADITGTYITYRGMEIKVPFAGVHQLENAAAAIKALEVIGVNGFDITPAHIKKGLEASVNPARTEVLHTDPLILLDGSHNDGSTKALRKVLDDFVPQNSRLLAVMGMMADKDVDRAIENLCGRFALTIAVTPENPRALSAGALAEKIENKGFKAVKTGYARKAVIAALEALPEYDGLIVCGSLYLAAEVRDVLIKKITELYK